jgi:diguanylate cyclase (GGDEF)-like protein
MAGPGRPTGRERWAGQTDVWMGAGLIWMFSLVVLSTAWALRSPGDNMRATVNVVIGAVIADFILLLLPWRRLPTRMLTVFPFLLVAMELALAATTSGFASDYTGFFTLAFIYIGLTQARGTPTLFALVVAPSWVYCQQGFTSQVGIRLPIALGVWILIGEVLAARAGQSRALTAELIEQASTDTLTGLASRLTMADRIDRSLSNNGGEPSSLLLLDLDGFKVINEAFGHAAGDELLVAVAERISACTTADDLVARLGGDEFAVYLPGCPLAHALGVGQRLVKVLAVPIELTRGSVGVTVSVGALDLGTCATAQQALQNVDVAMHHAKVSGQNRVSAFATDMQERIAARLRLESELRKAVDEDQFEVYYQPTVHAETRDTVGFEALVRWRHPQRGLLPAGEFIDVCEDMGLIVPLGNWILNTACQQASRWQPLDPARRLTMAVNLSARQLFDTDLVSEVREALATADLRGDALVLEITERLLLVDSPFVLRQLNELKGLGIRIAIDDFGTGYSSLAYLREFPIDILKIDRSFVEPLGEDHQAIALVRSIIGLAEALSLDVIAEGAETVAQVELLTQIGCSVIQGYYFGQPASAEEISGYLHPHGMPTSAPFRAKLR